MMEDIHINTPWKLYFHDPCNQSWTIDSYILLDTITSINQWVSLFSILDNAWNKGMFFLMRENILPLWEDDKNKNGGCVSFKLFKNEVKECWFELTGKVLGEVLIETVFHRKINGVSITPKRNYCIVRIWLEDDIVKDPTVYKLKVPLYRKMMYKYHSDNRDYKEE